MNRIKMTFFIVMTIFSWSCTSVPKNVSPIEDFEADRYMGKWYEIARLDHSFERNLSNVSAKYTRDKNGKITVVNKGFNEKTEEWKQIQGKARFIGDETVGSLKVSFFGPFYGGYHIIALDKKTYAYAMVTGPNRSYLWILSRAPTLDENIYKNLISMAADLGYKTADLIRVKHNLPDQSAQLIKDVRQKGASGETNMITPCPSKPNCVSSTSKDPKRYIEPLKFSGSAEDASARLLDVLNSMKRSRLVEVSAEYIRAEFTSAIMRFIDDVEFLFDEQQGILHVKSASRKGYYDMGVNRRRVEEIRRMFGERS